MADWKSLVRSRLAPLRLKAPAESELADELAQHLEDQYRDLRSGGASDEEAYLKTISELDDVYPLRAGLDGSQHMARHDAVPAGDATRGTCVDDLRRDLRYAGRSMRTNPMFVLFVVVTLGLGIGANTTVFTLINTLILNPLPVDAPDELAAVATVEAVATSQPGTPMLISYPNLKDYQTRNDVFRSLAGYTPKRVVTWQAGNASQGLFSEFVTANYFSTLAVRITAGRDFRPEEDSIPGASAVAVMNYGTWRTRFGGAGDIIGRQLTLNNVVVTVIGVAPPGFIGLNGLVGPDLWLPVATAEQLLPNELPAALRDRSKALFQGVGRFRPEMAMTQVQANMTSLASALALEYPAANEGRTATVRPIRDVMFGAGSKTVLFASTVLLIVVGIVLLIACSNVANLLLARSAARQQEMAVRVALGASRQRLVRQLLTESMGLALLSGAVGLFIGYAGIQLLTRTLPASGTFVAPKLDAAVLLFALLISLATGFLFGIIPALKGSKASVAGALKDAGRDDGRKPEEDHAGKHAAGGSGRPVVSPAGDGSAVPAEHSAGVRDRSRLPDGTSRGLHRESRAGWVRRVANQGVVQRRARACGESSGG